MLDFDFLPLFWGPHRHDVEENGGRKCCELSVLSGKELPKLVKAHPQAV
jgi:hypothetical protein